jgi:hypothetical protein
LTVNSSSQNSVSRGLIAPKAASWMIALRSSPFSFPARNCILIVLIAPVVDVMDITYSTTWKLFSFLFSQPLAMDTLPLTNWRSVSTLFTSTTCSPHSALKREKKDSFTGLSPGVARRE